MNLDESFQEFYSTLDAGAFKYFVKGGGYLVYGADTHQLPPEIPVKGRSVRLLSVDSLVREMLVVRKIPVEEYSGYTLLRRGTPVNYGDFADICLSDKIIPTLCSIHRHPGSSDSKSQPGLVEFAFLKENRILTTTFYDDDLLSRTHSLVSTNNCIEILCLNSAMNKVFDSWGVCSKVIKPKIQANSKIATELLKTYLKNEFEVEAFDLKDCCLIDISNYDLVDFGCRTQQGKRLLEQWIRSPLVSTDEISKRLDFSEFFARVNLPLDEYSDIKRLTAKILTKRITIQEIVRLYQLVIRIPEIHSELSEQMKIGDGNVTGALKKEFVEPLENLKRTLGSFKKIVEEKINTETCSLCCEEDSKLKEQREAKKSTFMKIEEELIRVKKEIPTVRYTNRTFKVPRSIYSSKNFEEKHFVVLSVLKTGVTFITRTLSALRNELEELDGKIAAEELSILTDIRICLLDFVSSFNLYNHLISLIDIYKAFSSKTMISGYSRPVFDGSKFSLTNFFHPMLEGGECVLNSLVLGQGSVCVITGPNMGGKSTILKAVSMVSLYAQIGCYVPAERAVLPVFDRVLFRIGAQDCSSRGLSTFMHEMVDMSRILHTASPRSLVLVDELGRGTSASDGLALATAIRNNLQGRGCRTLMATHFNSLAQENTVNMRMGIVGATLTYKLEPGISGSSFGLQTAELAGFPAEVLQNARSYLNNRKTN